ncbi:MAG: carboxypeptidase regulatory-like domain-containing protein, partial [Gaiellaceae bacterium]
FTTGTSFRSTPAVADGKLFVGGGDSGVFHALDAATGASMWSYSTGDRLTYAAPTVVDGTVYFGTGWGEGNGGWLYALDADTGVLQWKSFVGPEVYFAPAVGGGRVYAASYDAQRLAAFDTASGEELWSYSRSGDSFAAMPTYDAGRLYVATNNFDTGAGSVLALDASSGELLWEAEGHGDAAGNAPIPFGDVVIAGSSANNWVVAYDRESGEREWVHPVGAAVSNSQLVADGVVVGGSQQDHRVWALDAYSGELLWEDTVSDNVLSAPALADGRLVVADRSGVVRAYEAPGTVAGTVRDAAGAALDAEVRVTGTQASVRTDPATGAFELPHRPGTYSVEAYAYGYLVASTELTIRSGQRVERDFVLQPAAAGSLRGVVRDPAGDPLEAVELALAGTPLDSTTTGADGAFAFPSVAAGTYTLTAELPGWVPFETEVTVQAGEEATAEVTLLRYEIAVTGDHEGALTRLLESKGYRVEATTIAAIADRPGDYRLIVANGSRDDPGEETFRRFVANADAAEVSVIFLDTWGISYGSLLHLSKYTGDPPMTGSNYNDGEVSFVARTAHPLTQGLALGERVEALARETEYAWFSGYGGRSVADVYIGDVGRTVGSAIGYEPRSLSSVHVLLSLHAASPWTGPTTGWTSASGRVFDNAVRYALDASFGAVAGRVTADGGDGLPATVTAVETGDSTTAAGDGSYRLLLAAGTYTLRFERIGYTPQEIAVTVEDGGTATVDATLVSSGLGAVTGLVTSAAGGPVVGASVEVLESGLPAATTGDDGRFTVDGVPGGTYDVRVSAAGFSSKTVSDVVVADGAATEIAVVLERALRVAVLGDSSNTITNFLNANEVVATATGWEAIANLDAYDVLVLNNPTDPGEAAFRANLDALDAAGKSAIFIEGAFSTGGGVRLLRKYLGEPEERDFVSSDGDPFFEPTATGHPLFAGFEPGERIQVLAGDEWGAYFNGYSGIELAKFGTSELGVVGVGAAYEPRTPTSVRLLLAALGASSVATPANGWSEDGGRIFLNAVRWAAAPGLGTLAGRVADAAGDPIAEATVRLVETGIELQTGPDGGYELPHAPGSFTVEVSAFGYVSRTFPVTLTANEATQLDIELALTGVGAVAGTVTSAGDLSPQAEEGTPLAGATVRLVGRPRTATTAENGSFTLANVEPGAYTLEIVAAGHVRTLVEGVTVVAGETTRRDVQLRASPQVGVIDDCQQTAGCVNKLQAYLEEWGYVAEEIGWGDTERLAELDLVVANLGDFPRADPGAEGLAAFQEAANRAHVPVIWLEQFQRGSIRHLSTYEHDPASVGEDRSEGLVEAEIVAEHPLVAGFAVGERVPLVEEDGEHTWFDGYSGTTVAILHNEDGLKGSAIAYRGRTASSVDVLFSSFAASFYTWPPVGGAPAELLTPQALRLFQNALNYALDAPPLAAEARGTVRSSVGGTIASTVKVLETGKTYSGRAGDGTFFVPLQPGTWTLEVSAFGHASAQSTVTVAAGDVRQVELVLASDERGSIAGRVTDEAGVPLEGVSLALEGTLLATETAGDGRYRLDDVPIGAYELVVRKAGFGLQRLPVTVAADATTTVDVTLAVSRVIAVAGDHQNRITDFLTENGYAVVQWSWADIQQHVGDLGDVGLVVLNGAGTSPTNAEFTTFVDAATAAGKSIIFAGQFGNGSIRTLRAAYGDPATVTTSFAQREIYYRPTSEHPIFAGFPIGEPIELMRHPSGGTNNQQYEFFLGYGGTTLAKLGAPAKGGDLGDGVGFRFTSPTSVHVLLASLGAAIYGAPGERWSENAERIYLNAVEWALEAAQGQVFGTVTSGGAPVAGARVTAVERDLAATTGTDGTYRLGVPNGTHTIRVTAVGYEPFEQVVAVAAAERVQLDVELTAIERGAIAGTVVDEAAGAPLAGAEVVLAGAGEGEATTDETGAFRFDELLPGDYTLDVGATGYLPQTLEATVVAGETSAVAFRLRANDVGVLGDVDGVLVDFLRARGEAAEERAWTELPAAAERYDVVIVNGGDPSAAEFEAAIDAADAAGASVIFTGTWGVLNGGLRLLAEHRPDEVAIGGHGYRDGAVTLTGFDAAHPLFAGLETPLALLAPDSHYSWLDRYVGPYLARIAVAAAGDRGVSAAYDFRSAGSVHLILSAGAVSDFVGPGYGWTADGERLLLNAVAWGRDVVQAIPPAPTLATAAPPIVTASPVELTGSAEFRSAVTLLRDGTAVGTAEPARDGAFGATAALVEGPNTFTAVARNYAGDSPASEPVTVTLDTTGPSLTWTPADRTGFFSPSPVVSGTATDAYAGVSEVLVNGEAASLTSDGAFAADVELVPGENTLTVVARDRVGNTTTEARTVAYFAYDAAWSVSGEKGKGTLNAFLRLTSGGSPVQVDAVTAELVDADGDVVAARPMQWIDGKYQADMGKPAGGTYTLRGTLFENGFTIRSTGPTFVRAGDPVRP